MHTGHLLAILPAGLVTVQATGNPFETASAFVNPLYTEKLQETYDALVIKDDMESAAAALAAQSASSFVWIANLSNLPNVDGAISQARAIQESTGEKQLVGLVHYNLPDRDCSGGEAAGEFDSTKDGMERYKNEFVKPFAEKLAAASDLQFAIVMEPDSLGNVITNQDIEFCARAAPIYEEGLAFAISALQFDNVHLYIDIAHGGWLGWNDKLELTAQEVAKILEMAGSGSKIRGFSTNVSSFNPFSAEGPEDFMEGNDSWDESHYVSNLAPYLDALGIPSNFIIDQGRVATYGTREAWSEWCNVSPAGFGMPPGTPVDNEHVDSIVWVKPGGESDGRCGDIEGAPVAGTWFEAYAEMLAENADPRLTA